MHNNNISNVRSFIPYRHPGQPGRTGQNPSARRGGTQEQLSVAEAHLTDVGPIVPGTLPGPQFPAYFYQAALQHQLPQLAIDAIPANVPLPVEMGIGPAASAPALSAAASTGSQEEAPVPNDTPFVLETPVTAADVAPALEKARLAFLLRFGRADWLGAREVLDTLGNAMAMMRLPAKRYRGSTRIRENRTSSDTEKAALKILKKSMSMCGAFFMGACHHRLAGTYGGPWGNGLRFQPMGTVLTIDDVVDHYVHHFKDPELRGKAFKAALVQLSWLAPEWPGMKNRLFRTHEQLVSSALNKLSASLVSACDDLSNSPDQRTAFLEELISAVQPEYCSPFLARKLEKLPGFEQCGDGLATNLNEIKTGTAARLFPRDTSRPDVDSDQEAQATQSPEEGTGSAIKRPRHRGSEEEGEVGHRQKRRRTGRKGQPKDASLYNENTNTNTNTNTAFVDPYPLQTYASPESHAFEEEAMLRSTQITMPVAVRSNFGVPAVRFRIPAKPPEPLSSRALALLAQQQSSQLSQTIPPLDQASAPNSVGTQTVEPETPMPVDSETARDLFDVFKWD